jgi:hypothetical protein
MERLPYQVTSLAEAYVRSMYNVGSFFRTADAIGLENLYLCGITAYPPKSGISKTALGAEESVPWQHTAEACEMAGGPLRPAFGLSGAVFWIKLPPCRGD